MNAPTLPRPDWTSANQGLLVAEFAWLKARLRGEDETTARTMVDDAHAQLEIPAAIDTLAERFGLSGFERDVLLLVAGIEMDSELATLCAGIGEAQRPWPSFGLAMAVLPDPHWSALTPNRPLRQWRLIEPADETSLTSTRLRMDERVLHYIAGLTYLDARLQPVMRPLDEPSAMAASHRAVTRDVVAAIERMEGPLPVLQLWGGDPDGQRDVAALIAARLGVRLFAIACEDLPSTPDEIEAMAALWQREAALLDGALLIECRDTAEPAANVRRFIERVGGVTLSATREPMVLERADWRFRIDKPSHHDQIDLWWQTLGEGAERYGDALTAVASEFRLSTRDIERAGAELAQAQDSSEPPEASLWRVCRGLQGRRIDGLARRIEPIAAWHDLILPEPQKAILRQIAVHLRHRATVYDSWGFAARSTRGLGLSALFAGESGTGKTMAAEVLANELHQDLYRIDLSAVVSKYIGETEKNLARVFDAAEDSGIILLFDEADALFGKRSEVKDSHDRYANIEVSYLLQRMEAYRGLAILTTNQKAALDTAFHRRLRFVVNFPFPEAAERAAIWRGMFPAPTPTEGLDYAKLARLQVAGGNIRNIALNAAFLAADEGRAVTMAHILRAAQTDAAKRERPLGEAETRGWL